MSSSPLFHEWKGQEVIDECNNKLLGYAGSVPDEVLLSYLNEGKDAVWGILKEAKQGHLETPSQFIDSAKLNYFGPIIPGTREYDLPADFRDMEFIECMTPGFEDTKFTYLRQNNPRYQEARKAATAGGSSSSISQFYYAILGNRTISFAQYLVNSLNLVLWYSRAIADIDPDEPIDGVIMPYPRLIATYGAKRATLGLQDLALFDRWKEEWKEQILGAAASAGERQDADPEFVIDGDY